MTTDIHKSYWETQQGNLDLYYAIRKSLITGILEESGMVYKYNDNVYEIRKVA